MREVMMTRLNGFCFTDLRQCWFRKAKISAATCRRRSLLHFVQPVQQQQAASLSQGCEDDVGQAPVDLFQFLPYEGHEEMGAALAAGLTRDLVFRVHQIGSVIADAQQQRELRGRIGRLKLLAVTQRAGHAQRQPAHGRTLARSRPAQKMATGLPAFRSVKTFSMVRSFPAFAIEASMPSTISERQEAARNCWICSSRSSSVRSLRS